MNDKGVVHFYLYDIKSYGNEWTDLSDVRNLHLCCCEAVGLILEESADYVKIAQMWDSDSSQVYNILVIPKGSIYARSDKDGGTSAAPVNRRSKKNGVCKV